MSVKPQQIQELIRLLGAGQFAVVERKAKSIVLRDTSNGVAWELLGLSLMAQKKPQEALPALETAVKRMPKDVIFHVNLGQCLCALSRFEEAAAAVRAARALQPGDPRLLDLLGTILAAGGKPQEAIEHLREAVAAAPNEASIRYNLGKCLQDLKRDEEAEAAYRAALDLRPNFAAALHNLGRLLQAKEDWEGAEAAFRRAAAGDPTKAEPLFHLGQLAVRGERWDEAAALFDGAVARDPRNIEALRALCLVYARRGDSEQVKTCLRRILEIDPKSVDLAVDLAGLLVHQGWYHEADEVIGVALALAPLSNELFNEHAAIQRILKSDRALEVSCAAFDRDPTPRNAVAAAMEARRVCDWAALDRLLPAARVYQEEPPANILDYLFDCTPPKEFLRIARRFCSRLPKLEAPTAPRRDCTATSPLRIGFLSSDFCSHPVGILTIGVFEAWAQRGIETVLLETRLRPTDDVYRERFGRALSKVVPLGALSERTAMQTIADCELNVIVDMNGFTEGERADLIRQRLAPVQAQWLGYSATTGADWIDYVLVDSFVAPPGAEDHFSEKLVRLPGSFMPNDPDRPVAAAPSRAACGLPEDGLVFMSFNQFQKVTPEIFDVWMRLLTAVPGSVLWQREGNDKTREAIKHEAHARGVDPARLIFASRLPAVADHFARLSLGDIALDTFPYGSHSTGADALWAGVPLVALVGESFGSRISGSLLHAAGLPELVAHSFAEYESIALALARDPGRRAALRTQLAAARTSSPLFDNAAFADKLIAAFEAMLERHRRGLPPDHIDLTATRAEAPNSAALQN